MVIMNHLRLSKNIPTYSDQSCRFQILQLLEHMPPPKVIVDLGTMFGAFAADFALSFPDAKIIASDFWDGSHSGLDERLITQQEAEGYLKAFSNIEIRKLDYTLADDLHQLPKNADFVYVGGPVDRNVNQLISYFSDSTFLAGVRYMPAPCEPSTEIHDHFSFEESRPKLKKDLKEAAQHNQRLFLPFGCYNWMMPPKELRS